MAWMVAWGNEHFPLGRTEVKHLSIGENTVACDAFCGVFTAPNGYIKCFTQQPKITNVVAM